MGIYDRDYIREAPLSGEGAGGHGAPMGAARSAMAMWSVNTWIIVICVAVFAIDMYVMPSSTWKPVLAEQRFLPDIKHQVAIQLDRSGRYQWEVPQSMPPWTVYATPIYDMASKPPELIGESVYDSMPPLKRWLYFSTALTLGPDFQFWRLIGFQFLHFNMSHLLFNMLGLYMFGGMVEEYLGSKRYLAFYLLCGIFGALMYLLLNLLGVVSGLYFEGMRIPGLLFSSMNTPLVGASAGIFGVLMAGAYMAPREVVYFMFVLPIKLRTVAYVLLAAAIYTVFRGGQNAGGEAGHIGGALAGYYFIRHPHHLHGFFDFLGRIDPTSHHYRGSRQRRPPRHRSVAERMEIDRILDKIRREGMASLTDFERRVLHEASNRGGAR